MTEWKAPPDSSDTPADVASLYSWANLHGARYRDFSASRAQAREQARLRAQQALDEERALAEQEAQHVAEASHVTEEQPAATPVAMPVLPVVQPPVAQMEEREAAPSPVTVAVPDIPQVVPQSPSSSVTPSFVPPAPAVHKPLLREPVNARWFALKGVFEDSGAAAGTAAATLPGHAPVIAVFSLAGGVGKTSMVATLGRALAARGERVLLVDTASYGLLPFYFGARDQRPGVLRTFTPPASSSDAQIQMVTFDSESLGPENTTQEMLASEIGRYAQSVDRVIVDLATASTSVSRRVMRLAPAVLVPVVPDLNSVISVASIDSFFFDSGGAGALPYYVLNQFDATLPLHADVREVLRQQLGGRLLPFTLRRTPAMSEALAEGMTVMDYAAGSAIAGDYGTLVEWVRSLSAPAGSSLRGVRWSER